MSHIWDRDSGKGKHKLTSLGKWFIMFVSLFLLTTTLICAVHYSYEWTEGVKIKTAFRDPLLIAENTWSADTTIKYVEVAIGNIETLGLESTDYHAYFPWKRIFSNSIASTYTEMKSSVEVLEDIIRWKEKQYDLELAQTTGEIIEDLYHDKMYNYHQYVNDVYEWTSDINHAYALKNGYYMYFFRGTFFLIDILLFLCIVFCFILYSNGSDGFRYEV